MNNKMIIRLHQVELCEQGILELTGEKITVFNFATQEEETIDEIEPIHTYQGWKNLGYQVRQGEKAIAKFPIWKYATKKSKANDEETEKGKMFLKTSSFFSLKQVDKIKSK